MFRLLAHTLFASLALLFPCLVSHVWKTSVTVPGLSTLPTDPPVTVSGDYAVEVEVAVPAGTTSLHVAVGTILRANVISLVINADKAPMDIYTNAADGTGGQHIALVANKSLSWNNTLDATAFPNPLTQNISGFWINNASAVAGTFRAAFIVNG